MILNATNYLKFDTVFYFVTAVISVLRNAMQGLGETVIPLVSSALEMIGKVVIAVTLVPLLGYLRCDRGRTYCVDHYGDPADREDL